MSHTERVGRISVGDQRVNTMEMGLAVRYAEPRWQPDTITIGW